MFDGVVVVKILTIGGYEGRTLGVLSPDGVQAQITIQKKYHGLPQLQRGMTLGIVGLVKTEPTARPGPKP